MSLLAEEVVEEWLNRQGYFTIRGIKLGNDEIDILAIKILPDGKLDQRHFEVQASVNPISYISRLPKHIQKSTGRTSNTPKRSDDEIVSGVAEWVEKKFKKPKKLELMRDLAHGYWTSELVLHKVKDEDEVELIHNHGIRIHKLIDIVAELQSNNTAITSASGGALLELIHMSAVSLSKTKNIAKTEADIVARPTKNTPKEM